MGDIRKKIYGIRVEEGSGVESRRTAIEDRAGEQENRREGERIRKGRGLTAFSGFGVRVSGIG
jgi:hypothetical protein